MGMLIWFGLSAWFAGFAVGYVARGLVFRRWYRQNRARLLGLDELS
jgi:hypothetical protein